MKRNSHMSRFQLLQQACDQAQVANDLRERVAILRTELSQQRAAYDTLKEKYDHLLREASKPI